MKPGRPKLSLTRLNISRYAHYFILKTKNQKVYSLPLAALLTQKSHWATKLKWILEMSTANGVVVSIPKSRRARMPEAAHPTPLEQYLDKVIIISHFTLIGFAFFLFELWYVTSSHNKRASFHLIIIFPPYHIFVRFKEGKKLICVETTLLSYW